MRKEIAFLTVGQAGGNIGRLFEALKFNVLHINTCMEDLNTMPEAKHTYHIKDGEGAAKDRDTAKQLVGADIQDLTAEIAKTITEEYVFVIFSAGGGTGSGAAPMLITCLSKLMPDKKFGAITILPSAGESLKALINAYDCFSELANLAQINTLFVIDNNNRADKLTLNETFVELFMAMLKMPDYSNARGNIDTRELKEVMGAKGCIVIASLPGGQVTASELADNLNNSIFAQTEQDGIVQYIALSMASDINTAALCRSVGKPLDLFVGYNSDATVCVLSGLSYPYARLAAIKSQISDEQDAMKKIWSVKKPPIAQNNVDLSFVGKDEKPPTSGMEIKDIVAKFQNK